MLRIRSLATLLFVTLSLSLGAQSIDPTAATVKLVRNETVTLRYLEEEISLFETFYEQQGLPFGDKERSEVLWRLIDLILFKQAAERDHIRVTDEQVKVAIEQYRQSLAAQAGRQISDDELRASVISQGMSWDEYVERLKLNATPEV
ncbi:MAG: SurA N-terminal domain-containing protein, partial [Candidatus Eisenbacteria bacterium]|nr:SurA N-terminal domain-containing protein [Candidatus Eisenbacteria bacterium]